MNADLSAGSLVERMTRGKSYTTTELGKLFGTNAKGVTPTLTAAMQAKQIVGVKIGDGYKVSTRYYVAGTEPVAAEKKATALPGWLARGTMTGYDAGIRRDVELRMIGRGQ